FGEQVVDPAVQDRVAGLRARCDSVADDVAYPGAHCLGCMRIVAHEVAHAVAQDGAGRGNRGVGGRSGRAPTIRSPSAGRTVIGAPRHVLEGLARNEPLDRKARGNGSNRPVEPCRENLRAHLSPRPNEAKPATGRAVPAAALMAPSMSWMRRRSAASESYSTVLPS